MTILEWVLLKEPSNTEGECLQEPHMDGESARRARCFFFGVEGHWCGRLKSSQVFMTFFDRYFPFPSLYQCQLFCG